MDNNTSDERARFEAWYVDFFKEPLPEWFRIVHMWECWQAATRPFDIESMLTACVPGGYSCDPQRVADAIRAYCESHGKEGAGTTAAPMFWYRPCGEGLYEGPFHNNSTTGKMLRDEKPGEWVPLYAAAPAVGAPVAWLTEDGDRVVTEKTMAGARKDGGALLSSLKVYSVPAYSTQPAASLREQDVYRDPDVEHLAEAHECAMKCLDEKGVPRSDESGAIYSLWGRIERYKS